MRYDRERNLEEIEKDRYFINRKMKNVKQKIFLVFIGLFSFIFLLEISLRIAGSIYLWKRDFKQENKSQDKNSDYTVLCSGDSFTQGMGASFYDSYPMQLQRMLNLKNRERGNFKVVNAAVGGQNVAQVLEGLQDYINQINPQLIILLVGFNNDWNCWGYHDYIVREGKFFRIQNRGLGCLGYLEELKNKVMGGFYRHLYRSRVCRLLRILYFNIRNKFRIVDSVEYEKYFSSSEYGDDLLLGDIENINQMGWFYLEREKYDKAKDLFNKAIEIDPNNSDSYNGIGEVYYYLRKYEEAIVWFKKAIAVNPKDSKNYNRIAWCYVDCSADYEESLKWFKKAIEFDPRDNNNYFGIADVCVQNGRYDEALEFFKKSAELDPYDGISVEYIVNSYRRQGKYKEGIQFLSKLKISHSEVESFMDLFKDRGDIDKKIDFWMESDLEEIIRVCRKNGVNIILQNYPSNTRLVASDILRRVADKTKVPFVDNNKIFNELLAKGEKKENLFAYDHNHPNANGYGIMAKNLYDKIIEEKIFDFNEVFLRTD